MAPLSLAPIFRPIEGEDESSCHEVAMAKKETSLLDIFGGYASKAEAEPWIAAAGDMLGSVNKYAVRFSGEFCDKSLACLRECLHFVNFNANACNKCDRVHMWFRFRFREHRGVCEDEVKRLVGWQRLWFPRLGMWIKPNPRQLAEFRKGSKSKKCYVNSQGKKVKFTVKLPDDRLLPVAESIHEDGFEWLLGSIAYELKGCV